MTLYRARPEDGVAWITGASTGIGRALAIKLARQGYQVAATARAGESLSLIKPESEAVRGRIVSFACDVMDEAAMAQTVALIEQTMGPIALAVFNAGVYLPVHGERLETTNFIRSFETNVFGTIHGLVPVSDVMRVRGFGHIAVMGSVTALFGAPSAAAYGATKAALNNLAEGLRFDFERLNIRIQIINPGFVATPLTQKARYRLPALISSDEAANRIAHGLRYKGFEIAFPRRLVWPLKLLAKMPKTFVFRIVNRLTGWHKRPRTSIGRRIR